MAAFHAEFAKMWWDCERNSGVAASRIYL